MEILMFIHKSVLLHEVRVQTPDPVFAEKLLEQFGGATGSKETGSAAVLLDA